MSDSSKPKSQALKDTLAGTCGGIAQVLTGQPFDTIKVRLQTQPNPPIYNGMVDCFRQTVEKEGYLGLYKGTLSPLVGVGACVSIQFGVVEATKRYFKNLHPGQELSYSEFFLCGAAAGLANSVISIPVELIRIKMQIQTNTAGQKALYSGTFDCFKSIVKNQGVKGLYKGGTPSLLREVQGYGAYFLTYEYMMRQLIPEGRSANDASTWTILLCGALAGYGMWIPAYPIDVIKTKLQADSFTSPKYAGTIDCISKTFRYEGFRGFFRGFLPCMARATPVNAATFLAFELAIRLLGREQSHYLSIQKEVDLN